MRRTIVLICVGIALALGAVAFGVTYAANRAAPDSTAAFAFIPVNLETPYTIVMPGVAPAPNSFIVTCNDETQSDKVRTTTLEVRIANNEANMETVSLTDERILSRYLTRNRELLITHTRVSEYVEGVGRLRETAGLYSLETSQLTDVTPSNLNDIIEQPPERSSAGPFGYLWDEQRGLVRFVWYRDNHTMRVWTGKEKLDEIGSVSGIAAYAQLYVSGRCTYGAVTEDGRLVAYDFTDGKLRAVEEYAPIARALASSIDSSKDKLKRWVVAKDIAVQRDHPFLNIVTADGGSRKLEMVDGLGYRPNGEKRPDDEINALIEGKKRELLREESAKLPPDYIDTLSQPIALSEDSVGVLDFIYQRLVLIAPAS